MKHCNTCDTDKDESEFYRDRRSGCVQNAIVPISTANVKPCIKCGATDRFPQSGHCRQCSKNYSAKYHAEHTEQEKAYSAKYYADHLEHEKARNTKYAAEHQEQTKPYRAKHAIEHREQKRASGHKRRARKRSVGGSFSESEIKSLLKQQKRKCVICRVDISKTYHIDHIVPIALGGHNGITNIQLLCPFCNLSKHSKHPIDFMQSRGFLL